jgi:hypothetical protein
MAVVMHYIGKVGRMKNRAHGGMMHDMTARYFWSKSCVRPNQLYDFPDFRLPKHISEAFQTKSVQKDTQMEIWAIGLRWLVRWSTTEITNDGDGDQEVN